MPEASARRPSVSILGASERRRRTDSCRSVKVVAPTIPLRRAFVQREFTVFIEEPSGGRDPAVLLIGGASAMPGRETRGRDWASGVSWRSESRVERAAHIRQGVL